MTMIRIATYDDDDEDQDDIQQAIALSWYEAEQSPGATRTWLLLPAILGRDQSCALLSVELASIETPGFEVENYSKTNKLKRTEKKSSQDAKGIYTFGSTQSVN